jgi:DNA-binding NarL/FixJ family response regulator
LLESTARTLVVDDFVPWLAFVQTCLRQELNICIIGSAIDGLEAVQQATELQPDLVLLDVGLPRLNGIEAARQIRKAAPKCAVLFLSEVSDCDVVRVALGSGARGYVLKSEATRDLATAVQIILEGKRFVSHDLINCDDSP